MYHKVIKSRRQDGKMKLPKPHKFGVWYYCYIYIYIVIVIFYNKKITVKLIGKEWYLVITEKGIDS